MNLKIRVIGPDIILKREITLPLASPRLRDVTRALLEQNRAEWERIIQDDFVPSESYEILVKGTNIKSLEGLDTKIHEGGGRDRLYRTSGGGVDAAGQWNKIIVL